MEVIRHAELMVEWNLWTIKHTNRSLDNSMQHFAHHRLRQAYNILAWTKRNIALNYQVTCWCARSFKGTILQSRLFELLLAIHSQGTGASTLISVLIGATSTGCQMFCAESRTLIRAGTELLVVRVGRVPRNTEGTRRTCPIHDQGVPILIVLRHPKKHSFSSAKFKCNCLLVNMPTNCE